MAGAHVDDAEERVSHQGEDPTARVHRGVAHNDPSEAAAEDRDLQEHAVRRPHLLASAGLRRKPLAALLHRRGLPSIENAVDHLNLCEVRVRQLQEVLGDGLSLIHRRRSQRRHVIQHVAQRPAVRDPPPRQDEHVLEEVKDAVGRLVDRAQQRHARAPNQGVEEPRELEGRGAVEGARGLVQEQHPGALHQGLSDAQALLLPAGEPLPQQIPGDRAIARREPRLHEHALHERISLCCGHPSVVELRCVLQGLPRRQRAPQQRLLGHERGASRETPRCQRLAAEAHIAREVSATSPARAKREDVEERRLPGAAAADDGEHAAARGATGDAAENGLHRVGEVAEDHGRPLLDISGAAGAHPLAG
mmetsp:Transcript_72540/g.203665  ORF Transcript_72540/g.203665 Transcript_72540/m.203665 type:complete len:363 (+) Transcript_72540:852-1940(+)